jgi:hypothetical protein
VTPLDTPGVASSVLCDALALLFSPPLLARGRCVAADASPIIIVGAHPDEDDVS